MAITQYTKELPNSRDGPLGPIRVEGMDFQYDNNETLYTNLMRGAQIENGQRNLYGTRVVDPKTGEVGPFKWMTYAQVVETTSWLGTAMAERLNVQRQERVGVISKNRVEWCLVEHACSRMAFTLVPLYDTMGPTSVPYILNHAEIRSVFCAPEQLQTLLNCLDQCPKLERIIVFGEPASLQLGQKRPSREVELLAFEELLSTTKSSRDSPLPPDCPTSEDMATICYTSGTTGKPKGAVLTHRNMMAATLTISRRLQFYKEDAHLSYLPLAHVLERIAHMSGIRVGSSVGFYQGDVLKLLDDMQELRPTIFLSVPRLLNRVFDKIQLGVKSSPGLKRFLFNHALKSKLGHLERENRVEHQLWDALVFKKLRALLGGRVRFIVSGSAPIALEVKQFFSAAFSCPFVEGYGLTECVGSATVARLDMPIGVNVGIPYVGVQIRLLDVPEMNYTNADKPRPRGEVLIKGDCVFAGYYKDPEQTAEMLDAEGWLHTGDIGAWNADGTLAIIDRKKNIFKLSQGEYVAPEKVENVYSKSPFVQQIFVHGDSLQNYLVAVVVPDPEIVAKWAVENGLAKPNDTPQAILAQMCTSSELNKAILVDLHKLGKQDGLMGFEQPKKIHIHKEPFTMEQNLITPTFKLKRVQLKDFFAKAIHTMYHGDSATAA